MICDSDGKLKVQDDQAMSSVHSFVSVLNCVSMCRKS